MRRRKVALHTSSHLTPTEARRSADSTTSEGRRVSSGGTVRKLHAGLGGGPNLKSVEFTVEEKQYFTPVLTCPDLSGPIHNTVTMHVRSSCNVIFCTFQRSYFSVLHPILVKLHILTRLIDSFPMVHGSWICIEIEMLIPLGAHALRLSIERASSAVIF